MYRVLYRRWRPQVFSDVVGQPQVTDTLLSQVRENRLSHAYLFTGSRGTGKTTCAKILAKAVNCLHPVNGNPCNECEICRGIDNGTVLDIVEIDAAGNRGIDDIRLLKDEANFTPSQAKFRVYIIDEVHMLTIEAFNALLKTLEEPPEHVKFILATTEVHKLPSTILSRCQRFDFHRIEPRVIADRLLFVAGEEKAKLSEEAALLIARIADGGMRDALSLLDRAIGVSDNVTAQVVCDSAGLMGREYIYELTEALADRDTAKSLTILDRLHNASCDTERLCTELCNQFRNFLILKTVAHPENLIVCTRDELEQMKALGSRFTSEEVLFALKVLTDAADAIKRTQNRRIEAEMALIRLCTPSADSDVTALLARISALEKELASLKENGITVQTVQAPPVAADTSDEAAKAQPAEKPSNISDDIGSADIQPHDGLPLAGVNDAVPPPIDDDTPFGVDDVPPFDAAPPPFDEAPPPEEYIPQVPEDEPVEDKPHIEGGMASDFVGFAAEGSPSVFSQAFAEEAEDDAPFDFDEFMNKYKDIKIKEPPLESPPKVVPLKLIKPAPPPEEVGEEKPVPSDLWTKIVLASETEYNPLIGQLTGSRAIVKGRTLIIHPENPKLKYIARADILNKYLAPQVKKILGVNYNIKLED